ncbi:PREDICTED: probable serine/threonine-protein kinase clkA [Polistes canadensis]|uniref:probable serine/threonine-protein kinase clkA n=1 Tax=Polistes canadensis TaxID=91411 RepID=UPI000718BBC7|nr:PREDICTED: probable serine/threonine-protein kinase clkA [Polistes canadensis]
MNENYYNNSTNYSGRLVNKSLPSYSSANKFTNYAKDFVKPFKSSFQERKKIIPANTSSSNIVLSNNCLASNLNSYSLPFFQQNNQIFNSNNIEGSSFQNNLISNRVTTFNDSMLQPKEGFIQSYPYSQVISMLQSYSSLNDNFDQNESTNVNYRDQTNPWYFMYLQNVSNSNSPQQQTHKNFNIKNLQNVQQNQLLIDTYNSQNTTYEDVMKYDNMMNASSYPFGSANHFEKKDNNCINLVNQSECYVKKQFSSDYDLNNNVFNVFQYSQGRPILKQKL